MIIDKLSNIKIYSQIPEDVVTFLSNISPDIKPGKYSLNDNNYVNVEEYDTKLLKDARYEKHNKFIDIQIILTGKEHVYIKNSNDLNYPSEYNSQKDIRFYEDKIIKDDFVTLDGSNFVLIYPHEAHAPQVSVDDIVTPVKKAVVKLFF